jgi:hypothetical protein
MRIVVASTGLFIAACGGEPIVVPAVVEEVPDVMTPPDFSVECAHQPGDQTIRAFGDVTGLWSGRVEVTGEVTVPADARLDVCPGTVIAATGKIVVEGMLVFHGTQVAKVIFEDLEWDGLDVRGIITGSYVVLTGAEICMNGGPEAEIDLAYATFDGCFQAFRVKNGARFDHLTIRNGTLGPYMEGGMVTMVDTLIDLYHDLYPPDCTYWLGGGGDLDHVHFTGCHTPLHVLRAPDGFRVTHSIFDGASLPVNVAETHGSITHSHILFGAPQLLDGGGKLDLDVSGNYWGGNEPRVATHQPSQFKGLDNFFWEPLEDVGPRD